MTKKQIRTKRRRVKKQYRRKSRKVRKNMRGGSRLFVQKITRCIPQDPVNYSDIPISLSGYQNNDDDWTKLAENISYNGAIEFQCDGKDAQIYGINLDINFDTGTKKGELYGKIGNSTPVRLWRNGRQQTYEPPSSNILPPPVIRSTPVTPPRITRENVPPPPPNRRNRNQSQINSTIIDDDDDDRDNEFGVSLFENDIPYYRGVIGYNNLRNPTHNFTPKPPTRRQ
jgi:hypothetical protein